jgi:hypothetical protein
MNKDLHNIDDLFKNSIDGHAEEVPPDVWRNIDHGLDKKQAAFYKRKYFAVRAAAILLILIGGVTIAAILHFNKAGKPSSEDSSNQNSVTTSNRKENNGKKKESIQKEATKDLIVENKQAEKQNIVLDNNQDDKQSKQLNSSTAISDPKSSSKEYKSTNSDTYSAQKNEAIPVATNRNKLNKQNEIIKNKRVIKSSVDLVADKQNDLHIKTVEQANIEIVKTETARVFQRTTHIDDNLLSINKADSGIAFRIENFNGSPISFPDLSSAVTKPIKLKTHLGDWSISPMYAQNVNLNTLKDDDRFRDARNNRLEAKRTEEGATSFSVGIGVQKPIGRNIILQSGIQYFSSETNIEPRTIFAKPDARGDVRFRFYCSSGESYLSTKNGVAPVAGDSIKTNFSKSEISYLQIPLLVSYQINFGRFSLMPSAGIQTSFLLKGKLKSFLEHQTGEEEVSSSIDGLKSKYLSGIIQPQVNYKLSDRISFDFNPNLNFSLSPINKETAVKTYQNMFGVGAGIRIKL